MHVFARVLFVPQLLLELKHGDYNAISAAGTSDDNGNIMFRLYLHLQSASGRLACASLALRLIDLMPLGGVSDYTYLSIRVV